MIRLGIFNKKIKGKDVGFVLGIKGKVPYPQDSERWKLFGSPLCAYVNPYYGECAVEYFKDGTGQFLTAINVICWKPNFKVSENESEQEKFYTNFYLMIYRNFEAFFKGKNIEFVLEKMFNPHAIENEVVNFVHERNKS